MTKKEILLWLVLASFVAFTGYTVFTEGYTTFVPVAHRFAMSSAWGMQIVIDFLLAVMIGLAFVIPDARKNGINPWPFTAATLTLGSIGLLGYLIYRERAAAPVANLQATPQHA